MRNLLLVWSTTGINAGTFYIFSLY